MGRHGAQVRGAAGAGAGPADCSGARSGASLQQGRDKGRGAAPSRWMSGPRLLSSPCSNAIGVASLPPSSGVSSLTWAAPVHPGCGSPSLQACISCRGRPGKGSALYFSDKPLAVRGFPGSAPIKACASPAASPRSAAGSRAPAPRRRGWQPRHAAPPPLRLAPRDAQAPRRSQRGSSPGVQIGVPRNTGSPSQGHWPLRRLPGAA